MCTLKDDRVLCICHQLGSAGANYLFIQTSLVKNSNVPGLAPGYIVPFMDFCKALSCFSFLSPGLGSFKQDRLDRKDKFSQHRTTLEVLK